MVNFLDRIATGVSDSLNVARGVVRGALSFDAQGFTNEAPLPTASGSQVRQAQIKNQRLASATRNMVRWFLPETGIVEMYVNPESISYSDSKHIPAPTRTRGGYIIQYWGEELGKISIKGTTGSSGVEGINVLYDVYRNEQVAMDPISLAAEAERDRKQLEGGIDFGQFPSVSDLASGILGAGIDSFFDQVNSVIETGNIQKPSDRPTLASIAFQTEMYWSGWVFRGFFTSMNVSERADNLGLFDYDIQFSVTQKRGLRLNFMPWHRSAISGPSNSDPAFGVPYSYSTLQNPIPRRSVNQTELSRNIRRNRSSIDASLQSSRPL